MEITRFLISASISFLLTFGSALSQQDRATQASYSIRDGRMCIVIGKHISKEQLDHFIDKYDLSDLSLPKVLLGNKLDKLEKLGWRIDADTKTRLFISKQIGGVDQLGNPEKRIALTEDHPNNLDLFPSRNDNLVYGFNHFVGKFPFAIQDSIVTFFLKGHTNARKVLLAGSFTDWQNNALTMLRTDSGWIYPIKLNAGKYWYKFIINGGWTPDPDNGLTEVDPSGNVNSVYYKSNTTFMLTGFTGARDAYLSGSFNGWNPGELPMEKTPSGWTIHLYLAEGTYTYKFIVDGKWYEDPANTHRLPDGHKGYNSVYQLGSPHLFTLKGYPTAKTVMLAGDFNTWTTFDLQMHKTSDGWELPYTLGPGNYQYRFFVDGKWVTDPANPLFVDNKDKRVQNSFLIIQPNYIFRLRGHGDAKNVYLAGDFNEWTPEALKMQREGDAWVFHIHLSVGKHLYKFIVDGKWILDPDNSQWEDNEYNTGNSVLWMEDN